MALPQEAKALTQTAEWKGMTLLKLSYAPPVKDDQGHALPPQVLTPNCNDLRINVVWMAPVLPELPPVRASAYFFADMILELDKMLGERLVFGC